MTEKPYSDLKPDSAIGIFDSGIGGITVMKQIINRLPGERLIYFADSARFPYGTKSASTVTKFASAIVRFLLHKEIKMIVVACNSAQEAITGVARSDVLSRPLAEVQFESLPDELKDASRRDRMHSAVRQLLEMGSWPEIEENPLEVVEIQRADRERREFDAQAFGAPSGDGHRIGIICRNVAGGRAVGRCQGLRKEPQ